MRDPWQDAWNKVLLIAAIALVAATASALLARFHPNTKYQSQPAYQHGYTERVARSHGAAGIRPPAPAQ